MITKPCLHRNGIPRQILARLEVADRAMTTGEIICEIDADPAAILRALHRLAGDGRIRRHGWHTTNETRERLWRFAE